MAAATSIATVKEKFAGSSSGNAAVSVVPHASHTSKSATNAQGSTGYDEVIPGGGDGGNNINGGGGALLEDHYSQQQVPIWVGLTCKLVSGISKSTTCHDLISSIVPDSQDPSKYVVVEKWKKMERILDPSVKILKVWKAWGDQIGDVSFVLRSSPASDGYIDKKTSRKVHRKRSSNYHQQKDDGELQEGRRDAMEQLIKLVITQGEAIQAQLKKLRQQEEQIERYEVRMHKIRSSQLGENYVVDAYLKDDTSKPRRVKRREKSPCKRDAHAKHHHHHHHYHRQKRDQDQQQSGENCNDLPVDEVSSPTMETSAQEHQQSSKLASSSAHPELDLECEESLEFSGESSESLKQKTELMENIFQLNVKLTQEEERLVKLGLKIRKLSDKQRKTEWEELAVQDISQELEHLKQVTNEQSQEIEINEKNLTALEQLLDDKHDHVALLTHEIQLVDEEYEILQQKILEMEQQQQLDHHSIQQPCQTYLLEEEAAAYEMQDFHYSQYSNELTSSNEGTDDHYRSNENDQSATKLVEGGGGGNLNSSYNAIQGLASSSSSILSYAPSQHHQSTQKTQQLQQETCSSSCSNSSSVCVHLVQKPCRSGGTNAAGNGVSGNTTADHQDNDSNSDTGISSLHSSVDESPMYVLDTLV